MSIISRSILNKLNESDAVKKPYGDKPQEGKKEKLERGKKASVPKSKDTPKYKVEKLKSVNKQAGEIYRSDTDKFVDKINSTEHSDKGKIANRNTKKADRTVKFPYGDKVQPSDSKLVKESAKIKEAESITKGNQPGAVEFEGYANIIRGIIKEIFAGLDNIDVKIDTEGYHAEGNDEMDSYGMDVTIKPKTEIPGENGTSFWIGVSDAPYGAPGGFKGDTTGYLELFAGDESDESGEPCMEGSFSRKTPIAELKKRFRKYLDQCSEFQEVVKKAQDLNGIAQYRSDNEITDSAKPKKLKESDFDEYSDPVEVLEAIYSQYEELNMTGSFFDDLLNHTDLSLEDLIKWYEMGEEGECAKPVKECDKAKLTESDADQNFLNDYCDLLKKYCRTDVKELTLADDTEKVVVTYSNGATKTVSIAADSNLAAIKDIANFLAND